MTTVSQLRGRKAWIWYFVAAQRSSRYIRWTLHTQLLCVCGVRFHSMRKPQKPQVLARPIHNRPKNIDKLVALSMFDFPEPIEPFIFEVSCTSRIFDKYWEAQLYREIEHQFSASHRGTITTSLRLEYMDNILQFPWISVTTLTCNLWILIVNFRYGLSHIQIIIEHKFGQATGEVKKSISPSSR